jgi:hypothetical protein
MHTAGLYYRGFNMTGDVALIPEIHGFIPNLPVLVGFPSSLSTSSLSCPRSTWQR